MPKKLLPVLSFFLLIPSLLANIFLAQETETNYDGELVVEVVDGDSFFIENRQPIRLYGLDTPESEFVTAKKPLKNGFALSRRQGGSTTKAFKIANDYAREKNLLLTPMCQLQSSHYRKVSGGVILLHRKKSRLYQIGNLPINYYRISKFFAVSTFIVLQKQMEKRPDSRVGRGRTRGPRLYEKPSYSFTVRSLPKS